MISTRHLLPYLIASIAIVFAPGPSVLFTVARAVAWGRWVALLTVFGNAFGMLLLSAAVAVGFGPVLQESALLFSIVQWLGGGYLVWMGIDAIRHRVVAASKMTERGDGRPNTWQTLRQGFTVGVLNPKALVYFAAVLPQFVDPELGSVPLQLLTLGGIFCLLAVLSDGTWGVLAGTAREWLAGHPRRLETMRMIGGVVMIGLGIAVLATTPLPW